MFGLLKLKSPIGRSYNTNSKDVLNAKRALRDLGYYEEPKHGITPYPDTSLIHGIEDFQRDRGLRLDGVMKPGGETLQTLNAEVRGASVGGKKEGRYIWHTAGDGRVRSSHADRDGKEFSWDKPPEGGHPGEAPNCRCWAEDIEDNSQRCEELSHLIKVMEITIEKAKEKYSEAAEKFNAAQEAWNAKQEECKEKTKSAAANIGAGAVAGGLTGGLWGFVRGGAEGAISSADDVYEACINNSQEQQDYEQAKQELETAEFWRKSYEEDLEAYREEYEQLGCEK